MNLPITLTIAGSDSGAGAGIQADLRTFNALGVYGVSAITAVTAQNTVGVQAVYPVSREQLAAQLESILSDMKPCATKTGMLPAEGHIDAVRVAAAAGGLGYLIIDPVLVSTSGDELAAAGCASSLMERLAPFCRLITPNIREAEMLTGMEVRNKKDAAAAARLLVQMGAAAACVTGGHFPGEPVDCLFDGKEVLELSGKRIGPAIAHHGTGCLFSAAAAAYMARGFDLAASVTRAKSLVERFIANAVAPGSGMEVPWPDSQPA